MTLCIPPGLPARIEPLGKVAWETLAGLPHPVLVLVREVEGLSVARGSGLTPGLARRVNVGNVHFGPGRRPVTSSVFLSADELATLRELAAAGFEVEARAIPSESPAGMEDIERRYAASR
jgi:PTS system mannose-specific IIB component